MMYFGSGRGYQRYVSMPEKASQELARQRLAEVAHDRLFGPQAMQRPQQSRFLAYHADCDHELCPLAARASTDARNRATFITRARLHVYLSRV